MGFAERVKGSEADNEATRIGLETKYSSWQHAAFTLNQTINNYVFASP